jgi:nicotinamidase/pyrazinamidase
MGHAIIVVDCQFDFTVAGSLPVPKADGQWICEINTFLVAMHTIRSRKSLILATKDWHPEDHCSFATWPPHCIYHTAGAGLVTSENLFDHIIYKGTNPKYDSYSGFKDDSGLSTGLAEYLRGNGIEDLTVFGLATDYCVKATVLDALTHGFRVGVKLDLCRGVAEETTAEAIANMKEKGAIFVC